MHRLKTLSILAAFLVLAAIVAGMTAGPAIAQAVRATLVRDVDNPDLNPAAVRSIVGSIPDSASIFSLFAPPVPVGKRYIVTGVTVALLVPPGTQITNLALKLQSDNQSFVFLHPNSTELRTRAGFDEYRYHRSVRFVFEPGQVPEVVFIRESAGGSGSLLTLLHGYYVNL